MFVAKAVRRWSETVRDKTAYIEPGSPYESGFSESCRGELLNGEIFYGLKEAQAVIEEWRKH